MYEKLTSLKEMPKCQDGRVCNNKHDGFMVATFDTGPKFICYECYQEAKNELLLLLEEFRKSKQDK